jgi:hypothetical protein
MMGQKPESSTVQTNKAWVAPVITIIDLNAARHGKASTANDGTKNRS